MSIPNGVLAELGLSLERTGKTPQLTRTIDVLRTLFDMTPAEVQFVFALQGQADAIAAAGVQDESEECTYNSESILTLTDWHRFC